MFRQPYSPTLRAAVANGTSLYEEIAVLADWLQGDPEVPDGAWFKDFSSFFVCGEGELVKTFLPKGRLPKGEQVF